jgi:hypothetical protein
MLLMKYWGKMEAGHGAADQIYGSTIFEGTLVV